MTPQRPLASTRLDVASATSPPPNPTTATRRRRTGKLAKSCNLIDFERGAKLSGSRFYVLRERRPLASSVPSSPGCSTSIAPGGATTRSTFPFVVREEMLVGTGQLPKFADTMYHDAEDDLWLVPTAEVPVTNLYRDEILRGRPSSRIHHVAYSALLPSRAHERRP